MARIVYGRPSDNVAANAVVAVTLGTENSAYVAANIKNLDPANPAKQTTTSGGWTFDFTSAQALDLVAIINHNIDAGATSITLMGNATNSWGSPSLSQTFTIPTARKDGFSVSPFLDLTAISPRSFRWWRILVNYTNSVALSVGEVVMLATKRTMEINPSWEETSDTEVHPILEHQTTAGVSLIYDLGGIARRFAGQVMTTDAGYASLVALWQDARGRAKPFLFIPDPTVNDAWFVRMSETEQGRGFTFVGSNAMAVNVTELSRGLAA